MDELSQLQNNFFIVIGLLALMFGSLVVIALLFSKRGEGMGSGPGLTMREQLAPIQEALGGTPGDSFVRGAYVSMPRRDGEARIYLKSAGGKIPREGMKIELLVPLSFDLKAVIRHALSRLVATVGTMKEVQTGDPAFDRSYQMRASDPRRAARHLQSDRRASVAALLEEGHHYLLGDSNGWRVYTLVATGRALDLERVRRTLDHLDVLGAA